jgi:hypothetical protein
MSVLTGRELEFLASLNARWSNLYGNELARLLKRDDTKCDGQHQPPSIIRILEAPSWHSHRDATNPTET